MKTRTSFVSNSSSSSFVVVVKDPLYREPHPSITPEKVELLLSEGWIPSNSPYPMKIEWNGIEAPDGKHKEDYLYLAYCVICNEDEIIEFLLKNEIPFIATTHYGHQVVDYDPITDTIVEFQNYGAVFETYRRIDNLYFSFAYNRPPIVTTYKDKWLGLNK